MRGGEGRGGAAARAAQAPPPGRARPRRSLTCLGRRVLLASLEGVPEQQFIAPAPRAHQNHADGAGVVPHSTGGPRAGVKGGALGRLAEG